MKISAVDIHKKEFAHGMRGYREDEVDAFLDQIAVEVDAADKHIKELESKLAAVESRESNFEAERNTINNTLLTAQKAADDMLTKARAECERMLSSAQSDAVARMSDAHRQAQEFIEESKRKHQQLVGNIARLKGEEEKFHNAYLTQLDQFFDALHEVETEARGALQEIPLSDELMDELRLQSNAINRIQAEAAARPEVIGPIDPSYYQAAEPAPAPVATPAEPVAETPPAPVPAPAAPEPNLDDIDEPTLEQSPVSAPEVATIEDDDLGLQDPEGGDDAVAQWGDREDDLDIEEID